MKKGSFSGISLRMSFFMKMMKKMTINDLYKAQMEIIP